MDKGPRKGRSQEEEKHKRLDLRLEADNRGELLNKAFGTAVGKSDSVILGLELFSADHS